MSFFNKNAGKFLVIWIIILSILYSTLSILRHNHFQSGGVDLGIFDQTIWKYSQLMIPYNTIKDRLILSDHLNLTLPLLAPLFYLWDDIRILLIFQAFWLSFSALAVYLLCRPRGFSAITSLNLSFVYSLFYGIQFAAFFDFHAIIIGVGLIPWLVYFLESRRRKFFLISLILLLLTQENMGIALACLGIFYFFKKKYRHLALLFFFGGIVWTLLAVKIITLFSDVGFEYTPEITLNPLKIISSYFDSEEKRLSWFYSFSWFSFLPMFSPGAIGAVILDLFQYFASGKGLARTWSPYMHYRAILAPFLILGTLETLAFLKREKINLEKVSIILLVLALAQQYFFHFPLNKLSKPIYWQNEAWMDDNRALFKLISADANLAAQQNLVPHLSHRKEIYLVWPRKHEGKWWLDFGEKAEYLVVDLHPNQWLTQLLETNENFESAVTNMEKAGKITKVSEVNFAKLYRINYQ